MLNDNSRYNNYGEISIGNELESLGFDLVFDGCIVLSFVISCSSAVSLSNLPFKFLFKRIATFKSS